MSELHHLHDVVGKLFQADAAVDLWLTRDWNDAGHEELCLRAQWRLVGESVGSRSDTVVRTTWRVTGFDQKVLERAMFVT